MKQVLNNDELEFFEERAAIGEFDGGWPRPVAESEARRALDHRRWKAGITNVNGWLEAPEPSELHWPTPAITARSTAAYAGAGSQPIVPDRITWAVPLHDNRRNSRHGDADTSRISANPEDPEPSIKLPAS